MNIGHVGLGRWGVNFPRIYCQLKKKRDRIFVFDIQKEKTKKITEKYDVISCGSLEELIKKAEAVSIATPSYTHYEIAKKCLTANKDIFVEKPITLNSKQAEELCKIADKKKLVFMSGHILNYSPAIQKFKEIVLHGPLGELLFIYSIRINKMQPRLDCGVLFDYATHDYSLFEYLLGVSDGSFWYSYIDSYISHFEDVAFTVLNYGRVKCLSFVSWLPHLKKREVYAVGTKASALVNYHYKTQTLKIYFGEDKIKNVEVRKEEPLSKEIEHFIYCVKKRKKPLTDGWCGFRAVKTAEKILGFTSNN